MSDPPRPPIKGRGTASRIAGRFERQLLDTAAATAEVGQGVSAQELDADDCPPPDPATVVQPERAKRILTTNDSPDIPFEQSINPYRGCEHGCIYCYARPSHAWIGLSPGLDFETRLFYKADAAALLERELSRPGYRCRPVMLGANTDPYQPLERRLGITRSLLEVFDRFEHPVAIVTKGAAIDRDIDLLGRMAARGLASVSISLPTLDPRLKRILEPRAASPAARLRTMRALADAGVPVTVMLAPVIPALNDHEIERVLEAAAAHGARRAAWVMLRLPHEVAPLFRDWLRTHHPQRAAHVMSVVQSMRGGRDNDPCFGSRMRGQGAFAALVRDRFHLARRRLGLDADRSLGLDALRFRVPDPAPAHQDGPQRSFDFPDSRREPPAPQPVDPR